MFQHVSEFHSCLRLNNVPLCVYTTLYLSIHLLMASRIFTRLSELQRGSGGLRSKTSRKAPRSAPCDHQRAHRAPRQARGRRTARLVGGRGTPSPGFLHTQSYTQNMLTRRKLAAGKVAGLQDQPQKEESEEVRVGGASL